MHTPAGVRVASTMPLTIMATPIAPRFDVPIVANTRARTGSGAQRWKMSVEAMPRVAAANPPIENRTTTTPTIGTTPSITQSDAGTNAGRVTGGTTQVFSLPADVSWEPDLWGRVRLSVDNAVANAQVSAADLENVRLSEQALVAIDYFSLAAVDMQQAVLHDTIEAYQKNLKLTTDRFNGGVASKADITLAQTQLAGAQAQSTDLRV